MPDIRDIPWGDVVPMPGQPREHFDEEKVAALAESIRSVGQQVPALVAPAEGGKYELISGERRWRAVRLAGLPTLRAQVVDEPDPDRRYVMAVVDNMGREDHHPMEVAVAMDRLRRLMPMDEVARTVGKSLAYVTRHLSLLNLHPSLQREIHPRHKHGKGLPYSAALHLASLPHGRQLEAWAAAKASGRSPSRAVRQAVDAQPERKEVLRNRARHETHKDRLRILEGHLRRCLYSMEEAEPRFPATMRESTSKNVEKVRKHLRGVIAGATRLLESEENS